MLFDLQDGGDGNTASAPQPKKEAAEGESFGSDLKSFLIKIIKVNPGPWLSLGGNGQHRGSWAVLDVAEGAARSARCADCPAAFLYTACISSGREKAS